MPVFAGSVLDVLRKSKNASNSQQCRFFFHFFGPWVWACYLIELLYLSLNFEILRDCGGLSSFVEPR